jgi:hypothetical protein
MKFFSSIFLQILQKNLAGIGEPMVPTFGGLANIDPIVKNVDYIDS